MPIHINAINGAIGYAISAQAFENSRHKYEGQSDGHEILFDDLSSRKHQVVKLTRISKNVSVDEKVFASPAVCQYCKDDVLTLLKGLLPKSRENGWDCRHKEVKQTTFGNFIFTKKLFLKATSDYIHSERFIITSDGSINLLGEQSYDRFRGKGQDFKAFLGNRAGSEIAFETYVRHVTVELGLTLPDAESILRHLENDMSVMIDMKKLKRSCEIAKDLNKLWRYCPA